MADYPELYTYVYLSTHPADVLHGERGVVGQEEWLCDGSRGSLCCLIQARQPRRVGDEPCTACRLTASGISLVPHPELDSREMLCAKSPAGSPGLTDLLTRGSFHPGYKTFACPSRLGSSLWVVQTTGCLGLVQLQRDFGGEMAVSRGGKAGRGPRGMQRRRGNTSRQRAEPTGVADGPRPPPARLGRHKCVSLRVPDCRGVTGREITPGYHGNITSRDMPCCHPATRKGSPGTEGMLCCPRGG